MSVTQVANWIRKLLTWTCVGHSMRWDLCDEGWGVWQETKIVILRINIAALECSFSEKMRGTTLNVNNIKTKQSILLTIVCQIEWFSRYKCEYNQRWRKLLLSYLCGLTSIWLPLTILRTVGNMTCWFIALMTPWTFANTQIVNSLYFQIHI